MEWIYYAQYVANNGRPEWDRDGNLTFKLPYLTKSLYTQGLYTQGDSDSGGPLAPVCSSTNLEPTS